jgi:hypothetical protein
MRVRGAARPGGGAHGQQLEAACASGAKVDGWLQNVLWNAEAMPRSVAGDVTSAAVQSAAALPLEGDDTTTRPPEGLRPRTPAVTCGRYRGHFSSRSMPAGTPSAFGTWISLLSSMVATGDSILSARQFAGV